MADLLLHQAVQDLIKARDTFGWSPEVDEKINALRSLSTQPQQSGWMPIETAPKDGTEVILLEGARVGAASWVSWPASEVEEAGSGWTVCWDGDDWHEPTHWMRLPTSPDELPAATRWISVLDELPPDREMVAVAWMDVEDHDHADRYSIDYRGEGVWQCYFNEHEHYLIAGVAKGNSEDAPYTHWQRIGAIPAPLPPVPGQEGGGV